MKKYTLEDFAPRDPLKECIDKIHASWEKEIPLHQRMEDLYRESIELLSQIEEIEEEIKTKWSETNIGWFAKFRATWSLSSKISPLRSQIDRNYSEIDDILHKLIASRLS